MRNDSFKEKFMDELTYLRIRRRQRKNGYSEKVIEEYLKRIKDDAEKHADCPPNMRRQFHRWGYFIETAERLHVNEKTRRKHLTDLQLMYLKPVNNSFDKWFRDRLTPYVVLQPLKKYLPKLYGEVMYKDGKQYVIPKYDLPEGFELKTVEDILELLKIEKKLYIAYVGNIASEYHRGRKACFRISYYEKTGRYFMDGVESSREAILSRLEQFQMSFTIQEYFYEGKRIGQVELEKKKENVYIDFVSVFVGNRSFSDASVLDAYVKVFTGERKKTQLVQMTSLKEGSFTYRGVKYTVPKWKSFVKQAKELATFAGEVQLLKVGMTFKDDRILFSYISSTPEISRQFVPNVKLRKFFMQMVTERKFAEANRPKENKKSRKEFKRWQKIQARLVEKGKLRKGIRTYMFLIWKNSIIDDLLHTRGYSLSKKIWAWKRGFLSFRIQQYGLTEENYKEFLSDLDYHWLNRINNYTQKWVNDKTTFRYAMEPLKEHAPEYYFLVMHRGKRTCVKKMIDAPEYADCSIKSILEVLKDKKELAFKPSAGTHGDGFYKLEYVDGQYHVNGEETTQEDLIKVLNSQKSYYVVTDFLHLADDLAKIYPKSLNTIRMMTINENVHDPKIMHAYMRVGAASSGFTDNVGYGGIAVRIDLETGHYYGGEQIVNHCFSDCKVHPDTGVEIDGMIPHWDEVKEGILGFCKAFPELEYLGFDVAVTEESYKILEVNIHQDLHKYAEQSPEVKAYFARKKQLKAEK